MNGRDIFAEADRQWDLGNHKKAYALLLEAEAEGFVTAQNSIGYFLDHGLGVPKNKRAAFCWYRKAARNRDVCGIANVGLCYRDKGNGRRAIFWLQRAFDKGDGDAAFEMAKIYAKRRSNKHNRGKIICYLRLAIDAKSITPMSRDGARRMLKKVALP